MQQRSDGVDPVMKCMSRVRLGLSGKIGCGIGVKYPETRVSVATTAAGVSSDVTALAGAR